MWQNELTYETRSRLADIKDRPVVAKQEGVKEGWSGRLGEQVQTIT